jgi:hypothetical protein
MSMSVDELLRDDAERWAANFADIPPPDLTLTQIGAPRRLRGLAVAAAIAFVASAAGVFIARSVSDTGGAHAPGAGGRSVVSASKGVGSEPTTPTASATLGGGDVSTSKLTSIARSAAISYGDIHLSAVSGAAVKTTYGAAQSVLGGDRSYDVPAQTGVWIVEVHGSFTCADCAGLGTAPPPSGTVVDVIVNADTFYGYDSSLTSMKHDLSQFGQVIQLAP